MKVWISQTKSNPDEITKKLDSAFGSVKGFIFRSDHDNNDSVTFKIRKRVLYAYQMILRNHIIIKGKMIQADAKNETNIEISFTQHFLITFYVSIFLVLGLLSIIFGIIFSATLFIPAVILLVAGITLWIYVHYRFKSDIQKYKTLISEILKL
ncbi:MAG: DUF423 domain-containing protein [Clostridiaceae bacterium]|nr:DUF423 domain-containing protein [Clostridiaceae bacterium]